MLEILECIKRNQLRHKHFPAFSHLRTAISLQIRLIADYLICKHAVFSK